MPDEYQEVFDDDYAFCQECGWEGLVEDAEDLEDEQGNVFACCPECDTELDILY